MGWPTIDYKEEGLREGMQIESAAIPVADKVRLLDALSETGLRKIVVGSFVSPRWTPQMAEIDEIVQRFTPKEGVIYSATVLNDRGIERALAYSPPLTVEQPIPSLNCHLCDVFVRRNNNRSQEQEIARWPEQVEQAVAKGATAAGISVNAAWGSNFIGLFTEDYRMEVLGRQHELWQAAGIPVTSVALGDPMSWNMPHVVEAQLATIRRTWPEIRTVRLHLHNARGMAPLSTYAAMRALDEGYTLQLEGTIGGMGGCPYCGNGQVTGLAPTEDLVHMWQAMGIDTGVDLEQLVRCVWLAEEIVGHKLWGHVSKAGPFPTPESLYPVDLPFVETEEQAKHFLLGSGALGEETISPWKEAIVSPQRAAVEALRASASR